MTFQKYCKSMKELGVKVTELLAISLGVQDRLHYRDMFEDGCSIMRCNNYPCCKQPGLALGTGPHCDPTAITLLHQDQVGEGLMYLQTTSGRVFDLTLMPLLLTSEIPLRYVRLFHYKYMIVSV